MDTSSNRRQREVKLQADSKIELSEKITKSFQDYNNSYQKFRQFLKDTTIVQKSIQQQEEQKKKEIIDSQTSLYQDILLDKDNKLKSLNGDLNEFFSQFLGTNKYKWIQIYKNKFFYIKEVLSAVQKICFNQKLNLQNFLNQIIITKETFYYPNRTMPEELIRFRDNFILLNNLQQSLTLFLNQCLSQKDVQQKQQDETIQSIKSNLDKLLKSYEDINKKIETTNQCFQTDLAPIQTYQQLTKEIIQQDQAKQMLQCIKSLKKENLDYQNVIFEKILDEFISLDEQNDLLIDECFEEENQKYLINVAATSKIYSFSFKEEKRQGKMLVHILNQGKNTLNQEEEKKQNTTSNTKTSLEKEVQLTEYNKVFEQDYLKNLQFTKFQIDQLSFQVTLNEENLQKIIKEEKKKFIRIKFYELTTPSDMQQNEKWLQKKEFPLQCDKDIYQVTLSAEQINSEQLRFALVLVYYNEQLKREEELENYIGYKVYLPTTTVIDKVHVVKFICKFTQAMYIFQNFSNDVEIYEMQPKFISLSHCTNNLVKIASNSQLFFQYNCEVIQIKKTPDDENVVSNLRGAYNYEDFRYKKNTQSNSESDEDGEDIFDLGKIYIKNNPNLKFVVQKTYENDYSENKTQQQLKLVIAEVFRQTIQVCLPPDPVKELICSKRSGNNYIFKIPQVPNSNNSEIYQYNIYKIEKQYKSIQDKKQDDIKNYSKEVLKVINKSSSQEEFKTLEFAIDFTDNANQFVVLAATAVNKMGESFIEQIGKYYIYNDSLALQQNKKIYMSGINDKHQIPLDYDGKNKELVEKSDFNKAIRVKDDSNLGINALAFFNTSLILLSNGVVQQAGQDFFNVDNDFSHPNTIFSQTPVIKIAVGFDFCAALTLSGQLYTWGQNDRYQLGFGDTDPRQNPEKIKFFEKDRIFIEDITAGTQFMIALSEKNALYTWGCEQAQSGTSIKNSFGEVIGYKNIFGQDQQIPREVNQLQKDEKIVKISAFSHSAFLTKSGKLFVWGDNSNKQLGIYFKMDEEIDNIMNPVQIQSEVKFSDISCGFNHSIAVGKLKEQDVVLSWGNNEGGQLGQGNKDDLILPKIISPLTNKGIFQVRAGSFFSLALGKDGSVYGMGFCKNGQFGVDLDCDCQLSPTLLSLPLESKDEQVIDIQVGNSTTAFFTVENKNKNK